MQVTFIFPRLIAALALAALTACAAPQDTEAPEAAGTLPGYGALEDGGFSIPQVAKRHLWGDQAKAQVAYAGDEKPGSIVVDTFARKLYFVMEDGRAMRYAIAVGREGLRFTGSGVIGRKAEWPAWQPTANMIKTRPDLYLEYAAGMEGGLDNPLGARAMYLYRGGRDTMFRIHGTLDDASIGHATSAGCIRLFNQDAIDLYDRIKMGASVKVRSLEESLAAEGPYIDDAWGRAIPDTEANRTAVAAELLAKAAAEAKAIEASLTEKDAAEAAIAIEARQAAKEAKAAARLAEAEALKATREAAAAERKAARDLVRRLAECRRLGIPEEDCPPPGEPLPEQPAAG